MRRKRQKRSLHSPSISSQARWAEVREPNEDELRKTLVLRIPLTEASAKVRSGPPIDDEADYTLPVWAGELPLRLVTSAPISDHRLKEHIQATAYIRNYQVQSRVITKPT